MVATARSNLWCLALTLLAAGCNCGPSHSGDDGGNPDAGGAADAGADAGTDGGPSLQPLGANYQYTTGTRIKVKVAVIDGGPDLTMGFVDSQLGFECAFRPAADGVLRCMPYNDSASADYFASADCNPASRVLVKFSTPCAVPTRAVITDSSSCPDRTRVFAVGGPADAGAGLYQQAASGCVYTGIGGVQVYSLASEEPSVTFAAATLVPAPELTGVGVDRLVAGDGARTFDGFRDTVTSAPCWPGRVPGGAWRCLPSTPAYGSSSGPFADAACSQLTVTQQSALGCPAPFYGLRGSSEGCADVYQPLTVGTEVASLYSGTPSACSSYTPYYAARYFRQNGDVPLTSFPLGTPHGAADVRRVYPKNLELPGGALYTYQLFDADLGAPCSAGMAAADGSRRCLPLSNEANWAYAYGDAACTQPLAISYKGTGCSPRYVASTDSAFCPVRFHLYPVTGAFSGQMYTKNGAACQTMATPSGAMVFSLGAELDPSAFVATPLLTR